MRVLIPLLLLLCHPLLSAPVHYSLEQVLDRVHAANRGLLSEADKVEIANLSADTAESAFDLMSRPYVRGGLVGRSNGETDPAVTVGYDFSKKISFGTRFCVEPSFLVTKKHYHDGESRRHFLANVSASITQPLLRGIGREYNMAGVYDAEYGVRTAVRQQSLQEQQLIIKSVTAVYQVLRLKQSLEYKRQSHESLKQALQSAQLKEKIGLADAMDVYRAELEVAQADENVTLAQEALEEALDQVKELMELPLENEIELSASMDLPVVELSESDAVEHAIKRRLEVEQAEDALENQFLHKRISEHKLLPELNWVFNYSANGNDPAFVGSWRNLSTNTWGLGLAASGSYDRDALKRGVTSANKAVEQADRILLDIQQRVAMDVKGAYRSLTKARKKMEVQEDRVAKSDGKRKLAELKFDRGLASNFDLIQADKERLGSQEALTGARIDYIVGTYRLRQALGTLMEKPNVW